VLLAGAPPFVGAAVGVVIVDGVTAVPAADTDSPTAETPEIGPVGARTVGVAGAGALAEVLAVSGPVEAAGVPVGVGLLRGDVAGAVPVGVRMSVVAGVGAAFTEVLAAAAGAVM
jgi:hypothetical protein